jgi:hypothetical protein
MYEELIDDLGRRNSSVHRVFILPHVFATIFTSCLDHEEDVAETAFLQAKLEFR